MKKYWKFTRAFKWSGYIEIITMGNKRISIVIKSNNEAAYSEGFPIRTCDYIESALWVSEELTENDVFIELL